MNSFIFTLLFIAQGMIVRPILFEVEAAPGQRITKKVTLINASSDTLFVRSHVEHFDQDSTGKTLFSSYNDNDVIINPVEFSIPPQDEYSVRITVKTPEDMSKEKWFMLVFQQMPPPLPEYAGIRFVKEVGVPFYLIPIGAMPECDIDTSFIRKDSLYFRIINPGIRHIRANGTLKIFKAQDQKSPILQKDVKGIFLLPQKAIYKAFPLDTLKKGQYVAKFRVDFHGPYAIEGVKSFMK